MEDRIKKHKIIEVRRKRKATTVEERPPTLPLSGQSGGKSDTSKAASGGKSAADQRTTQSRQQQPTPPATQQQQVPPRTQQQQQPIPPVTQQQPVPPATQQQQEQIETVREEERIELPKTKLITKEDIRKEHLYLMERDHWIYAMAFEKFAELHKKFMSPTDPEFENYIERHFEHFRTIYDRAERAEYGTITKKLAERLLNFAKSVKFKYNEEIGRFELFITDKNISHVELSSQLSYILGYDQDIKLFHGHVAKFSPELKGSISSLCIYLNHDTTESIIFGENYTNLLQVVAVEGESGSIQQKIFPNPLFHKIACRELDSLDFEIRGIDGRFIMFEHG